MNDEDEVTTRFMQQPEDLKRDFVESFKKEIERDGLPRIDLLLISSRERDEINRDGFQNLKRQQELRELAKERGQKLTALFNSVTH